MISENKLKEVYSYNPEGSAYLVDRKYGEYNKGYFDIFKTILNLDIRIALADYGVDKETGLLIECCQFVPRSNDKRGYIVLSNNSSIERIRFNCAIMLYCALKDPKKIATYNPSKNNQILRNAKLFAVTLLMPEKALKEFVYKKTKAGKYKYLDEKGEISLDNINAVAAHFGVPFKTCASRILKTLNNIQNIKTSEQLMREIKNRNYIGKKDEEYKNNESAMLSQLVNSLRYLNVNSTRTITLEKILRECVKNEALLEGVVKDCKGVNYLLQVFANGGEINEKGALVNKVTQEEILLMEDQLLILGNYELLKNIAYQKASYYSDDNDVVIEEALRKTGYTASNNKEEIYGMGNKYLEGDVTFKEGKSFLMDNCKMNDTQATIFMEGLLGFDHYTIRRWHKILFNYSKENEHIKGKYRNTKVIVPGANFDTADASQVNSYMEGVNYDIIELLKRKDELSNYEYINEVNMIVARFVMIHPFEDGNGRVSRALMNFLYKKKKLPFVFINADKQREAYIKSLKSIDFDDIKFRNPKADVTELNLVVCKSIMTSYSNIYDASKMLINPERELSRNRLKKPRI